MIKKLHAPIYKLLLFISHFSNGILCRDLSDASKSLKMFDEQDWFACVMFVLLTNLSKEGDKIEGVESFEQLKNSLESLFNEGKTQAEILVLYKKSESGNNNNEIINITDMKLDQTIEFCFVIDPSIRTLLGSMEEEFNDDGFWLQKTNVLKYYFFLFNSIISRNSETEFYLESQVEATILNSNKQTWKLREEIVVYRSYVTNPDMKPMELQDIIKCHDTNIRVLMNESLEISFKDGLVKSLRDLSKPLSKIYLMELQDFMESLYAISKIYEYYEEGQEFVSLFRQLNSTEESQAQLKECEIKGELFSCDLIYRKLKKSRDYCTLEDIKQIDVQFKTFEYTLQKYQGDHYFSYNAEFLIAKYYILALDKVKWPNKDAELIGIISDLKKMRQVESLPEFLIAKIDYVVFDHLLVQNKYSQEDILLLKNAVGIFTKYNSNKLLAKSLVSLAKVYSKNYKESFDYAKQAQKIATAHKIQELSKGIKDLIAEAHNQIRRQFQNKLYFLNSYPLRDQPDPLKFGGMNIFKYLLEEMKNELKDLQKDILVHYDTFRQSILQELFEESKGCKLLAIDFLYLDPNALILEAPNFRQERVTIDSLKSLFGNAREGGINVDILLVVSDQYQPIIKEFADYCKIPVTVYFDFKKQASNRFDLLHPFLTREYMYAFTKKFAINLCSRQEIRNAIDNAHKDAFEQVLHEIKKRYDIYIIKSKKPDGTYSSTKEESWTARDLENILSRDSVKVHSPNSGLTNVLELSKGGVVDTSTFNYKDIYPSIKCYLRRDLQVVSLYDKLKR